MLNEDVFFTSACEMLHKQMPDIFHCSKLAIEAYYCEDTSVYHGWNKNHHSREQAIKLLLKTELFRDEVVKLLLC